MTELAPKQENVFNFFWKIKNFSYAFEVIDSPEFYLDGGMWHLSINPRDVTCRLVAPGRYYKHHSTEYVLSFISCDDSLPLSASGSYLNVSKNTLFRTRRKSFLPEDTLTIYLWFPNGFRSGNIFVQSQIGVNRKCLVWTLRDLEQDHCDEIDFITATNCDMYGSVELRLKCTEGINSDEQFYIEVSRKNGEQCCCVLKISVLGLNAEVMKSMSDEFLFKKQDGPVNWKFPPIIKKSELLVHDGVFTLSLKCEIAISSGKVMDVTEVLGHSEDIALLPEDWEDHLKLFKTEKSPVSKLDLQSDMENILNDKVLCDASFQIDSEVFHVHKAILSGRSPFFKSLFIKDLKEIDVNNTVLEGIDVDTFRQLLCYLYTDTINNAEVTNIIKLYRAADDYLVQSLKKKCSSLLMASLSISNFGEILALADVHADKNLEESVLGFISRNHSEIVASKEWKEFEENNSHLAFHALKTICSKKRFE